MRSDELRLLLVVCAIVVVLAALFAGGVRAADPVGCVTYAPNPPHEPSGVKGCERYGDGIASRYPGPGVARNDCVFPWTSCTPIVIIAADTGRSVTVTPTMFCDCYQRPGPNGESVRLVDLDPATVAALGLDWSTGLYRVHVAPAHQMLPDTAVAP